MEPQAQVSPQEKMEVIRRRAQMGASSTGIGGDRANSLNPGSPIASGGPEMMSNPEGGGASGSPAPSGGASGSPSDGAVAGMKEQKGEARTLADALIWRMKKITERGE